MQQQGEGTRGRCEDNIKFIQQTIDPKRYNQRPAPLQHPTAIYKKVDVNGNFITSRETNNLDVNNPIINNSTGVVLWFPKRGVGTIMHMAIVPQGTVCDNSTDQISNRGLQYTMTDFGPGSDSGLGAFIYSKALALPYQGRAVPVVAPNLSEEFSLSRCYGGLLELWSSTTSTGANTFNGTVSASVISDTRDVAQNDAGDDCYAVVDIAQSARTMKESIKEVDVAVGVISVQGADIESGYRPPDSYNTDQMFGSWQRLQLPSSSVVFQAGLTSQPFLNFRNLFAVWASPWGVKWNERLNGGATWAAGTLHGTGAATVNPIEIDRISEDGILDVDVTFKIALASNAPNITNLDGIVTIRTSVEHYFGAVKDDGSIAYTMIRTVRDDTQNEAGWSIFGSDLAPAQVLKCGLSQDALVNNGTGTFVSGSVLVGEGSIIQHSSRISSSDVVYGNFASRGKFLGVRVSAVAIMRVENATGAPHTISFWTKQPEVRVRARELWTEGTLGPVHIIRYDRVGAGQNIRFSGCLNTESVCKADIAAYVQDSVMQSRISCDSNVYPLVYMLYNGNSPFKHTWTRPEWLDFVTKNIYNLSSDTLMELAEQDSRVRSAAHAAGFFSGLGKQLGGMLGGMVGHPNLGRTLGHVGGSLVDSFAGAEAQFGDSSASATAQFGGNSWVGRHPRD